MSFNILICDDSALARKMARRNLPDGLASEIYEASNGVDALEIMGHHRIDLVLLDLTMPILDGVGVLEEIKRRKIEVFVVVISGDIQPVMQNRVMELGALAFIEKPLKRLPLETTLKRYGFILPETMAC
ncbi:response regulator [Alteromonas sp. KS69]|jgi:two-component system chemotaxis response regulator CheY|uniref:Response regulator with chemotaxis-specific methylesterase domain n=2 Tax=Alteromonas TaxID=226 RepID=F5ZAG3_ALTNA|nr:MULTISPECIES: response regulator [Alteromonas]MBB67064.1 response regulator [Rickettsiales bacterium]PHS55155.1 MAG: response regulator [Alteromonas sp.]AEF01933.1 putative response regulator with chemotaxis-specific methylesterase domain [Alteromonas naphthalenivorans]ANB24719.1 chemotaxis protein [Alteromonas stellipolaris]MBO7923065.1 response regulator [Alteromonas sp. K632G]|tara:strand:- start:498 stop:884 length:387 start_codon:yes stop_codon:yes gene_type:complete